MDNQPLTISMLAGLDVDATGTGLTAAERAKLVETLRDRSRELKELAALDLGERLFGFIAESLRKPVSGLLTQVWKQRKEMREIAAQGKDGRDVVADIELIGHTVTWKLKPSVQIEVNKLRAPPLVFDVSVSCKLDGVKLVLKNAHITEVKSGTLTSTVDLRYKEFPLMAPRKKTIALPGVFELPSGGIDLSPSRE